MDINAHYFQELSSQKIIDIVFSGGTYELEVYDSMAHQTFWPFIQIDDQGKILDFFCTCPISEEGKGCPHLAIAYERIDHKQPLHVRFQHHFFNVLCHIQAHRNHYQNVLHRKDPDTYFLKTSTHKLLFSVTTHTEQAEERLQAILWKRKKETEETSIKFSGLSAKELNNWKQGVPSDNLRYELSFWSDLAKWLFFMQEDKEPYDISFSQEILPHQVDIHFPELSVHFYIARTHWAEIIPSLSSVRSPFKVHEDKEIEKVIYDREKKMLKIFPLSGKIESLPSSKILLNGWYFVPEDGFYLAKDRLQEMEEIPKQEIGSFLTQYAPLVQKYLFEEKITLEPQDLHYLLFFDQEEALHIQGYLFEKNDLSDPQSAVFFPWVYIADKGFFCVKDPLIDCCEKRIPRETVSEFVSRHRLFLHHFPGFQTHLGTVESYCSYHFTPEGDLQIDSKIDMPEVHNSIDFGQWVYVPMQGFYAKEWKPGSSILQGYRVPREEIGQFFHENKEFLEQMEGFFISQSPIEKIGLVIRLGEGGCIVSEPIPIVKEGVKKEEIELLDHFVFYKNHGFFALQPSQMPSLGYDRTRIIEKSQQRSFVLYDLPKLMPFIVSLDPRLQRPAYLQLHLRSIEPHISKHDHQYLTNFAYVSPSGSINVVDLYEALQAGEKMLFSSAGCIDLTQKRFWWIKTLGKGKRIDHHLLLTPLEWIRLCLFEEVVVPLEKNKETEQALALLQEEQHYSTEKLFNISLLQSSLRPYQQQGAQWLFFLYCHGLSGMLCDEMGLGKTHQAMALIAATGALDPSCRYLVVCPTSVIYHWKELLSQYLPSFSVDFFHGLKRNISSDSRIILTSYGIVRQETALLGSISFEIAIFDELQIAKNFTSKVHQALLSMEAKMRLGLTGTPIENRLRELKSLMDLVLPGYLPKEGVFRDVFVLPIEKYKDEKAKMLLHKMIRPFILRRKKQEVLLDLPEKMEEIAYCDLSAEQVVLYREVLQTVKKEIFSNVADPHQSINYIHIFSSLTKLKRICDHPCLVIKNIEEYEKHDSGKWDLFVELFNETIDSEQKLVIFSQYLDMIAIFEKYLMKRKISYALIKGSTKDRPLQLKKFQHDPECRVFIGSLMAAGLGIDLTAASVVIHYDRWWNPSRENQATDRVHRLGQNRGVQVFKLVTKNTIEERIHSIIVSKKELMEETVGQDDFEQIKFLSREELMAIFSDLYPEETL
ncbi:MAG: DEAD/DEAH box helicase [Parachlamydiales bacterium]|nr:DEAD/DEAH box helicase [Parachlamydiales bacterium]